MKQKMEIKNKCINNIIINAQNNANKYEEYIRGQQKDEIGSINSITEHILTGVKHTF